MLIAKRNIHIEQLFYTIVGLNSYSTADGRFGLEIEFEFEFEKRGKKMSLRLGPIPAGEEVSYAVMNGKAVQFEHIESGG